MANWKRVRPYNNIHPSILLNLDAAQAIVPLSEGRFGCRVVWGYTSDDALDYTDVRETPEELLGNEFEEAF